MAQAIEIKSNENSVEKISKEERISVLKDIMIENLGAVRERLTEDQNVLWNLRYIENKSVEEIAEENDIKPKKVSQTLNKMTGQITSYEHLLIGQDVFVQGDFSDKMQKGHENFLKALEQTPNEYGISDCSTMIMGENRKTFAQKVLESGKSKKEISQKLRDFEIEFRKNFKKIKNG